MNQLLESVGASNLGLMAAMLGVLGWKFRMQLAGLIPLSDWLSPKKEPSEAVSLIKQLKILSLDLKEEQRNECLNAADVFERHLGKNLPKGCSVSGACLADRN